MAQESIEHPVGTFAPSEATPNPALKELSLDQLQGLVEWPSKLEEFTEAVEPEAPPEPEPVKPETVDPVPESTPEIEQEAEPVKVAEPSQEDIDRELLAAKVEAYEAQAKKLEAKLVGREAGEQGYIKQLKQRIQRLEAGMQPDSDQVPSYREERGEQEIVPSQRDGMRAWAVQQATKEAFTEFMGAYRDSAELEPEMTSYLQRSGFNGAALNNYDDPIAASREVRRVLDEAYWDVKEARVRARVEELTVRKAESVRGLEAAKRKAASSGVGSSAPPPAARPTTKDLSLADLEARMAALTRR